MAYSADALQITNRKMSSFINERNMVSHLGGIFSTQVKAIL